jgi:ABC-type sugar transport system ATPase subunit
LTVAANLFLGRETGKRFVIDTRGERQAAEALFERLGVRIDPEARVSDLTVAEQQLVEIGRALLAEAKILIMDEPTAALAPREVDLLFKILGGLRKRGIGIVFISHRLDEVLTIADRITVMRDGRTVVTRPRSEFDRAGLIERMVGRPLDKEFPPRSAKIGEVRFEVRGLRGGRVRDISFAAREGEVLGITGLMGAGRTEAARLMFGADRKDAGRVILDSREFNIRSPRDSIRQGICLLTEDRKSQGLVLIASARDNFALPNLCQWSSLGVIDRREESSRFARRVSALNIKIASADQPARDLSGGNQQKLLVARWLEARSRVIIFDEPTRGIDVGAKYDMYLLINALAAEGKTIILISSELPEILGLCDRILVMKAGRISGEITNVSCATQEDIMQMAI